MITKRSPLILLIFVLTSCTPMVTDTYPWPTSDPASTPFGCYKIGDFTFSSTDHTMAVCVPAGEFIMGADNSDPGAQANEKPPHTVYVDTFWIDRSEVTNWDYGLCVARGGCDPRPTRSGTTGVASHKRMNYYYDGEYADYPVLIYDVQDAIDYCEWAGRRLPTEAEWEKAARGTDGRIFPWGNSLDCTNASFSGCTEDTMDVDSPEAGASPYGALNMSGNVWEWVSDPYMPGYYANSPSSNPSGPANGEGNVRRGGGWRSLPSDLRVTSRASGKALHYFDGQMGFRCAISDKAK